MPTIEWREADYEAKLRALRAAPSAAVAALERGDFKQFLETRSLKRYLDGLADEVLSRDTTHP
jgi:antitoxin ParD1/3/4